MRAYLSVSLFRKWPPPLPCSHNYGPINEDKQSKTSPWHVNHSTTAKTAWRGVVSALDFHLTSVYNMDMDEEGTRHKNGGHTLSTALTRMT